MGGGLCGVTVEADAESDTCIGTPVLAIATAILSSPCDGPTSNSPSPAVAAVVVAVGGRSCSSGCETWIKLELLSVRLVPVEWADVAVPVLGSEEDAVDAFEVIWWGGTWYPSVPSTGARTTGASSCLGVGGGWDRNCGMEGPAGDVAPSGRYARDTARRRWTSCAAARRGQHGDQLRGQDTRLTSSRMLVPLPHRFPPIKRTPIRRLKRTRLAPRPR